jgi:pimeloyl-ACP methyl ester carboxylesterase
VTTVIPDLPELRRTDSVPDTSRVIAFLLTQLEDRRVTCATRLGIPAAHTSRSKLHIGTPERVERLIIVAGAPSARVLENVRCPVLVVLGALDELAVPARPRVQIELIAGHDPHLDAPDRLRALSAHWINDSAST